MRCPACRAEHRPGARFCEQCGTPLERRCASCGAVLSTTAKFCSECGAPVTPPADVRGASPQAYTPAHLAARILRERSALTGERKQVTVLFADVSNFTSLSERLDPEDVHGLINHAFEVMLTEIHAYEGTVNQFLGDGLMALFGAPVAHEDHALRAAHAALGLQRGLARYRDELSRTRGIDFRVRLGLNTGLVVVGAIGDNLRMDYTAVGDTTNTAARMQQLAEPGQVVVAEPTARLIEPYFELRQLGTFVVKHREQPVAAAELVRARPHVSRLVARAAHGLSPFVGRDEALAALERAWAAARAGHGQVVLVTGEAGMGKSRLLLELQRRIGQTATWLQGDCISYGQSIPFLPIVEMLRRTFEVHDGDSEADVVTKIARGCAFLGDEAREVEPLLRYLLSVDPGDPDVATRDPARRRAQLVTAVQRLVAAGSGRRPTVLVVEDAHWIDSAAEDFLKSFVDSVPGMALLLVVTYRPSYQQPFGERSYFRHLIIQPVEDDAAARIVRAALGIEDLPDDVVRAIAGKAEGNPFFLEELGRALVETGAVRTEGGRLVLTQPAASLTVPDTVQDVIAARLDRLAEPHKRTVQTAAVIGREFALSLLQRVSDLQQQLEASLTELKRIELVYERLGGRDLEYVFRHALTQDVAYASLLQSERRRLHGLIGRAIEELHPDRLEERSEELVYHFTRGEAWDRVVHYAREAAARAEALCADDRAVEHYETALQALARLPETPDTARAGVELRLALRAPLWRAGQLDAIYERFREAESLATRHALGPALDTIYAYLVQYHWAKGQPEEALDYGHRCLARAAEREDVALRVTGHYYLLRTFGTIGRHREALAEADALRELLRGRERERFGLSGLPYSGACALGAFSLSELGDPAGALAILEHGRAAAEAAGHLYSSTVVGVYETYVLAQAGRAEEAIAVGEPTVATCREKKFAGQLMLGACALAEAYAAVGRGRDGVAMASEAIALQERVGAWSDRSYMHMRRALAHVAAGDLDAAAADVTRSLALAETHGERGWMGWAHYVDGLIAARRGDRARAEAAADAAQEIAEELGLRPLLERCRGLLTSTGRT
jgi:class 3 adenylate cyclase